MIVQACNLSTWETGEENCKLKVNLGHGTFTLTLGMQQSETSSQKQKPEAKDKQNVVNIKCRLTQKIYTHKI